MRVGKVVGLVTTIFQSLVIVSAVVGRVSVETNQFKQAEIGLAAGAPAHCIAAHRAGKLGLAVTNNGTLGSGFSSAPPVDFFTGEAIRNSCEYPRGSNLEYLYGATLWIGAVVGNDTLVSTGADGWSSSGAEMFPDEAPFGYMIKRSTLDPDSPLYDGAVSEEDYIAVYMDTLTDGVDPDFFGRPHMPLDLEVTQSSYAWSYPWTEDFVLIDYQIKNIGVELLSQVFIGFYVDADICWDCGGTGGFTDDLSGFLTDWSTTYGNCEFLDTINVAWSADNDGDLNGAVPVPHVTGLAPLGVPADDVQYNFNWWVSSSNASFDFGPRLRPTPEDPWRDFGTGGLGTPEGDVNKHYIMRHREFDYDQAYTATIQPNDTLWLYPNQDIADDIADGFDTRYLLSFGPFDIAPGQTLPLTMAYVGGENLHTVEGNAQNLPDQPDVYYSHLDFSDLAMNTNWAKWVYDNPGVDTDQDGYFGKFHVCCDGPVCDTFYYEGDGVPDFDAVPNPVDYDMVWLEPREEALWVRWNGLHAETAEDILTGQVDFEGYRAYLSPDGTPGSYVEVESYDIENYLKYTFSHAHGWELREYPMTIEELRCLYGASCDDFSFDPNDYTEGSPYVLSGFPDSLFYFEAFGLNKSHFGISTTILKMYPDQPYPTTLDPGLAQPEELTEDGFLEYFEYELTIDGLLAGECYHVNVTRTDYGAPHFGIPGDESDLCEASLMGCTPEGPPAYDYGAGWNLVSSPVIPVPATQAAVFGDDLAWWQLYGWDGSGYYSPTDVSGCGVGYWLFLPDAASVDYVGDECAPVGNIRYCDDYPVAGWQMVGSAFKSGVQLNGTVFQVGSEMIDYDEALARGWITNTMYGWDGSDYYPTSVVPPGRGCWFATLVDDLTICWYRVFSVPERPSGRENELFALSLEGTMRISLDGTGQTVYLGLADDADAGFDAHYDSPCPPTAPGVANSIYLASDESTDNSLLGRLRTDVRGFEDKVVWKLVLTGNAAHQVNLENSSALSDLGYRLSLHTADGTFQWQLGSDQTVDLQPGEYRIVASRGSHNDGLIPEDYFLSPNYPNPFNPVTTIAFGLPSAGRVRLEVFNLLGQKVVVLLDERMPAGVHEISWHGGTDDGVEVSSGVYFYRLETAGFGQTRKMLLIK